MKDIVIGVILIIVGVFIVIRRAQWARKAIEDQNKIFGFHFGKKDVRATAGVGLLVGCAFIIVGTLALVGVFNFK